MKRFRTVGSVLLLVLVLLVLSAAAQVPPGRYQQNPYTGGVIPQRAVNPLTGTGLVGQQTNPLTGTSRAPSINPLTGKPMPAPAVANPLMGSGPQEQDEPIPWPSHRVPMSGKAGAGLEVLDRVIMTIMERHGIPGTTAAIARNGKLIYARGFGWADLAGPVEAEPATMFGLASLSKPLTALSVLLLVEQGKLSLDDQAFKLLAHIRPPRGSRVNDPRIYTITVRQLLNHTGGWDRAVSGEPMNLQPQMARAMRVPLPLSPDQFISFMMTGRLDFAPGTNMAYSNLGYVMLGQIIEKVSGQPYDAFVRKNVLEQCDVGQALLSRGRRRYQRGEAHCYLAGSTAPYGPQDMTAVAAAAGWSLSAVDMVRVLTRLDGSRGKPLLQKKTFEQMLALPPPPLKRRPNGSHNGLGWPTVFVQGEKYSYVHDGMMYGMRTFMRRSANGINWAIMFNVSMQPDESDASLLKQAVQEIHQHVEGLKNIPDVDLFKDFP
jgi:N-acyl-D-amino-acid deacylase